MEVFRIRKSALNTHMKHGALDIWRRQFIDPMEKHGEGEEFHSVSSLTATYLSKGQVILAPAHVAGSGI